MKPLHINALTRSRGPAGGDLVHNTINVSRGPSQLANSQPFAGLSFAKSTFIIVGTFMELKVTDFFAY